jgi:hypothetical protein
MQAEYAEKQEQGKVVFVRIRPTRMTGRKRSPHSPSRSHDAVIRVYDEAGNVIETHEHVGDFKEP